MDSHVPAARELSIESGRPGLMSSFHSHKELEINLLESGAMTYMFGGSYVTLGTGRLAVFWATIPHRVIHIASETKFYCINLSLSCFLRWQLSQEFTSRLLRGEMIREPSAREEQMDRMRFDRWREDLTKPSAEHMAIVEAEVQARLRRLALSVAGGQEMRGDTVAPANRQLIDKVEEIAKYIGEHYQDPISVEDIGGAVGLHPKYASTVFKKHCGMTIGEYLTEQRLSQAKRLLATTENKIVDIAYESGFNSVSRFYEVFELNCGQTPKEYRAHISEPSRPIRYAPEYTGCNIT